jgi:hypothetical protein
LIAFIGVNVIEYLSTCNTNAHNAHNASAHEPGAKKMNASLHYFTYIAFE